MSNESTVRIFEKLDDIQSGLIDVGRDVAVLKERVPESIGDAVRRHVDECSGRRLQLPPHPSQRLRRDGILAGVVVALTSVVWALVEVLTKAG
jgi:hypothetical protein